MPLRWLVLALTLTACAGPVETVPGVDTNRFDCSRLNPTLQTAVLEAVVYGGGPLNVKVSGWMCVREALGVVRIVMLEYKSRDETGRAGGQGVLVPVVFENGALIAFGWHVLEARPDRYGSGPLPDRDHPWRIPG